MPGIPGDLRRSPDRTTLAIAAGEEGLKYSREAFDARVVYALHHRLGQLEMKGQNWDDAWKHLLSAAFMAPDDLLIMLDLARVYDKQGQVRRAYARYKRVAAAPGAPPRDRRGNQVGDGSPSQTTAQG